MYLNEVLTSEPEEVQLIMVSNPASPALHNNLKHTPRVTFPLNTSRYIKPIPMHVPPSLKSTSPLKILRACKASAPTEGRGKRFHLLLTESFNIVL